MSGQGGTHAGGRLLGRRGTLPHFLARDWLPHLAAHVEGLEVARTRHEEVIGRARGAEAAVIDLAARYDREDTALAAALSELARRSATEAELPVASTGQEERRARLRIARERFADAIDVACDTSLEIARDLRTGASRRELIAVADAGLRAPAVQDTVRRDGARCRVLLFEELDRPHNLVAAANRVRGWVEPFRAPSSRAGVV